MNLETTEGLPSIKEPLTELYEKDCTEEIQDGVLQIGLPDAEYLLKVEGFKMDFAKGREIAFMRLESADIQTAMLVSDMSVAGRRVTLRGYHDNEEVSFMYDPNQTDKQLDTDG